MITGCAFDERLQDKRVCVCAHMCVVALRVWLRGASSCIFCMPHFGKVIVSEG